MDERSKTLASAAAAACKEQTPSPTTPWERHAAALGLPRYDYSAPSSLASSPRSGFLVTCPIKREKSATKEAISLLHESINDMNYTGLDSNENSDSADANYVLKKRKICCVEGNEDNGEVASKKILENSGAAEEYPMMCTKSENFGISLALSLVKLQGSGLLLFTFSDNGLHQVVQILLKIFVALGSGKLKRPQWCHRILPIQRTCLLVEDELHLAVSKLFKEFVSEMSELDKPIKFAVGYNRRGIDELEVKSQKNSENLDVSNMMDREKCIRVVASAVSSVTKNSVVDLKSPEVAVFIEVLPVSGLQYKIPTAGVAVLPAELISTKPRLSVKSLLVDSKSKRNA